MLFKMTTRLLLLIATLAWPLAAAAECTESDPTCCVTNSPGASTCELTAKPGDFPRLLTSDDCNAISGVSYPDGTHLSPNSDCSVCGQDGTTQCVVWEWDASCGANPDHFTFMVPNDISVIGAAPGPSNISAPGAGDNKGVGALMAAQYAIRINSANDNANPLLVTAAATTKETSVVASFGKAKEACELGFADELVNTFVPVNPVTVYNFKGCTVEFKPGAAGGTITSGENCSFLDTGNQQSNGVPFSDLSVKFGGENGIPLGLTQSVIPGMFIGSGSASCITFEYAGRLYAIDVADGLPGC